MKSSKHTASMRHRTIQDIVELGAFLRDTRKDAGLTQNEAAGLLNVGRRFLIELEQGKPTASLGKTLQVLRGYGLDIIVARRGGSRFLP